MTTPEIVEICLVLIAQKNTVKRTKCLVDTQKIHRRHTQHPMITLLLLLSFVVVVVIGYCKLLKHLSSIFECYCA